MIKDDTFLATLTVGEFKKVIGELQQAPVPLSGGDPEGKRYEYGLAGIRKIFGCSTPTAMRIKNSGIIDAAITQVGRKIVIDAELALQLAGKPKGGRK